MTTLTPTYVPKYVLPGDTCGSVTVIPLPDSEWLVLVCDDELYDLITINELYRRIANDWWAHSKHPGGGQTRRRPPHEQAGSL